MTAKTPMWAMVPTPFTDNPLDIDADSLRRLAQTLAERGADGLILLGVVAEPAALTISEMVEIVGVVAEATPEISISAAIMTLDERERETRIEALIRELPDAINTLMIPVTDPRSAEFRRTLIQIHRQSGLPILIQDYPAATGVQISVANLLDAIQGLDFVAGIKCESPPTFVRINELSNATNIALMAGFGGIGLIDDLVCGAQAFACGITRPEVFTQALMHWDAGDEIEARARISPIASMINFEIQPLTSIGIRKEHWRRQGVIASARTRQPTLGYPRFLTRSSDAYSLVQ